MFQQVKWSMQYDVTFPNQATIFLSLCAVVLRYIKVWVTRIRAINDGHGQVISEVNRSISTNSRLTLT